MMVSVVHALWVEEEGTESYRGCYVDLHDTRFISFTNDILKDLESCYNTCSLYNVIPFQSSDVEALFMCYEEQGDIFF